MDLDSFKRFAAIVATLMIWMAIDNSDGSNAYGESHQPKTAKADDAFEPDNSAAEATQAIGSTTTAHNFFDQDDEDWILLVFGGGSFPYTFQTLSMQSDCATTLEIYKENPDASLELIASETSSTSTDITGLLIVAGNYYARVTNSLGIFGANTGYTFKTIPGSIGTAFPGSLAGVVQSSDGNVPVPGATIEVRDLGYTRTNSDNNGIYSFATLPKHNYTATASAPGYVSDVQPLAIDTGANTKDFVLIPIPILSVDPASRDVPFPAGQTTFTVTNTGTGTLDWSAAITAGADWVSFNGANSGSTPAGDPDGDTLTLDYSENPTDQLRSATIELTAAAKNGATIVAINQAPNTTPTLEVQPSVRNVGFAAGSTEFTVSNSGFGTLTYDAAVISGNEWLSIPAKGDGGGTVTTDFLINNTELERTGTIRISAAGALNSPIDVSVVQAANTTPTLDVSPANRSVGSAAGNTTFTVTNTGFGDLQWNATVTAGADWLSVSTSKASGGGSILAQFELNPTGQQRIGTIEVTGIGALGSPHEVTVTQAANTTPVLSVSPAQRNVGSIAGTTSFDIANAGFGALNWTADISSGGDWLEFAAKQNGTGAATIDLSFSTNVAGVERSATVTVTATGALNSPQVVTILQAPDNTPALNVHPASRSITSEETQTSFEITNAGNGVMNWTAEIYNEVDWATVSTKVDGSGNATLLVSCEANTSIGSRLAIVRISSIGATGSPIDVNVIQAPAEIEATDLNGDSAIDAQDVQLVINAALALSGGPDADVDNDGDVDAVDVQLVINAALGL
jgi:hypothetical protein